MLKNDSDVKNFESFILQWNIENPVDRWWRSKHSIAFNSSSHREISFIDMYMEFYEETIYEKALKQTKKKEEDPYVPGTHDFLYPVEHDKGEDTMSEEDFNDIEI